MIVAGIHTSEQSGVEVARWINAILTARPKPLRLGAVIVPEAEKWNRTDESGLNSSSRLTRTE
jgi:hypothetical protein